MNVTTRIVTHDVIGVDVTCDDRLLRIRYHTDSDAEYWSTNESIFGELFDVYRLREGVSTTYRQHLKICDVAAAVAPLQD